MADYTLREMIYDPLSTTGKIVFNTAVTVGGGVLLYYFGDHCLEAIRNNQPFSVARDGFLTGLLLAPTVKGMASLCSLLLNGE